MQRSQKRQQEIEEALAFIITNISNYALTYDQIIVLSKGLGSIATPDKPSKISLKTKYNTHFAWKYIGQALLKHWNIIKKKVRLKMIIPKPPTIAYSRSENLRDSLVKAKTPYQGEEWLHVWRSCEKWGRSTILTNPAHTSRSGSGEQMFQHVHRFWWNRGRPKYTRSYNRRQDHEDHSSRPFRAHTHEKKNIPDKYGR